MRSSAAHNASNRWLDGTADLLSHVRILKEIRAMMEGCQIAIGKGQQVRILAPEMDEDDDEDE